MVCSLYSGLEYIGEVGKPIWDVYIQNWRVIFEFFFDNVAYEVVLHGGTKYTYMVHQA